jgi:diacylglycerol kinase family enzyme
VLPGGTMNRIARRLGLPQDIEAAVRALALGETGILPLGLLNGQPFLYQSVAGHTSRLIRFREMQRGAGLLGWTWLLRAILRTLLRPGQRSLRLHLGGRSRGADIVLVTTPGPGDEAVLRVEAVRRKGLLDGLRLVLLWLRRRLADAPQVVAEDRARVAVHGTSPLIRVTLDGEESLMAAPLRYRLHRDGVRVLRPRPG